MTRAIGIALLLLLSAMATIVVRAPAAWVGDWLEARSKLRLGDARDARWALSTVAPLGSYRLRIAGAGAPPTMELVTLSGPLQMQGKGTMEGSRIRFKGVAGAEPEMRPALNGLLGVLGMRSGDKVLLAIDT